MVCLCLDTKYPYYINLKDDMIYFDTIIIGNKLYFLLSTLSKITLQMEL